MIRVCELYRRNRNGFRVIAISETVEGLVLPKVVGFVRRRLESDDCQLIGLPFNQITDEMVSLAEVLCTTGFVNGTEVMVWDGEGHAAATCCPFAQARYLVARQPARRHASYNHGYCMRITRDLL